MKHFINTFGIPTKKDRIKPIGLFKWLLSLLCVFIAIGCETGLNEPGAQNNPIIDNSSKYQVEIIQVDTIVGRIAEKKLDITFYRFDLYVNGQKVQKQDLEYYTNENDIAVWIEDQFTEENDFIFVMYYCNKI